MIIYITIHLPEHKLEKLLLEKGKTREHFIEEAKQDFKDIIDTVDEEIFPGATAIFQIN